MHKALRIENGRGIIYSNMKKFWQTIKYKRFNKKHAERQHRRRLRSKERKKLKRRLEHEKNWSLKTVYAQVHEDRHTHELVMNVPENFSIIENAEQMLLFFEDFKKYVIKRKRIFFDMSKVNRLTGDAIIYMLSMFDRNEKLYGKFHIRGNVPENGFCRNLLFDSGFFNYVYIKTTIPKSSEDIVQIEKDSIVKGKLAKQIIDFTKNKLNIERAKVTKSLYDILIECMVNTNNHAFGKKEMHPFWYLMAVYDKENKEVFYTFLDAGQGIPKTIRKKYLEKVFEFIKTASLSTIDLVTDKDLIISALEGVLKRSRIVKKGHRGKGLPRIYEHFKNKQIEDLVIISKKGYVDLNGKSTLLSKDFAGTMLSWKIRMKEKEAL